MYHFCGCFWHLPQFFNFLLKTWASEQYSMFQHWARQLRRRLISRTISSVSVLEKGEGEGGGIPGSNLCFVEGPLLWDSRSFSSYKTQPLSEHICFHKLSCTEGQEEPPGLLFGLPWASAGFMFSSASCKYAYRRPDSHIL